MQWRLFVVGLSAYTMFQLWDGIGIHRPSKNICISYHVRRVNCVVYGLLRYSNTWWVETVYEQTSLRGIPRTTVWLETKPSAWPPSGADQTCVPSIQQTGQAYLVGRIISSSRLGLPATNNFDFYHFYSCPFFGSTKFGCDWFKREPPSSRFQVKFEDENLKKYFGFYLFSFNFRISSLGVCSIQRYTSYQSEQAKITLPQCRQRQSRGTPMQRRIWSAQ